MLFSRSMLSNLIDRVRLPFRKEKELYSSLFEILGFYPRNIGYYKLALMHKSVMRRGANGKPVNNERLEFLGDAILDAIVGDIVYRHFPGKREGFLTNTRSKLVQRETLNRLAQEMGISRLILSSGHSSSHNSYMGGNAFEALVGAIYLDRGYASCMRFMEKRILAKMINIDKVAYKEVNFKSKLIEWSQKNRVKLDFIVKEQGKDKNGSPFFLFCVELEGIEGCKGRGYSKKESQQLASKLTLERLKKEPQFIDQVFAAKASRTKKEGTADAEENAANEQQQPEVLTNGAQPVADGNAQRKAEPQTPPTGATSETDKAKADEQTAERTNKSANEHTEKPATECTDERSSERAAERKSERANERKARNEAHRAKAAENAETNGQAKEKPNKQERRVNEKAEETEVVVYRDDAPKDEPTEKQQRLYPQREIEEAATETLDFDDDPEFDLSHITARQQSREEIIAAAEAAAFSEEHTDNQNQ